MPDPRAVALSVVAFNDVAVHARTKPQTLDELRECLKGSPHMPERVDWTAAHAEYVQHFERDLHDPDTLNWRDQRAKAIRQRSATDRQRRDRAPVRKRSNL